MEVKIFSTREDRETLEKAVEDLERQLSNWEWSERNENHREVRITGASTAIAFHPVSLCHARAHVMATLTITYDYQQ